jgi:tetratricopeptide (TPR) repeat protein
MADWRVARLLVLGVLVLGLGAIVYRQGFGWQLGGAPASLDTAWQTEEAWIAGEIVRDITEMSAYAADRTARPDVPQPEALGGGRYKVSQVATLKSPLDVNLADGPWSPEQFVVLARAALDASAAKGAPGAAAETGNHHPALTGMTPERIVRAGQSVSAALATNMRDAHAHDSAALVLGAFALRESAALFSDVRWTLNRMTSHLAMAAALRGADEPASIDGALAEVVLNVLTRHQTRALDQLARLGARAPSASLDAWRRALQVRVTQDWRTITLSPSTTALEELEYLRARRQTVPGQRGIVEAETLQVGRADALRIVGAEGFGVEDGHVIAQEGLDHEREEAAQVFQLMHDRALFDNPNGHVRIEGGAATQLNARATRAIAKSGPDVLPWGAWAECSQRHIAMLIGTVDRFYRHKYGDERTANGVRQVLDQELSGLTLYPVATSMRTKGVNGGDADLTHINEAIALATDAPELITARLWAWLERGSRYEAVRRAMPTAAKWFIPSSAHMTYDAALRVQHVGQVTPGVPLLSALLAEAPFDYWTAAEYLKLTPALDSDVKRVLGPRLEYDLRAIRVAINHTKDDEAALALHAHGCELAVADCARYARALVNMNRADEAARQYERTFADPSFDRVSFSNQAGWLVTYYYERKKIERALELAEEAADVGAAEGLTTAGYLYERLGRAEEAEEMYEQSARRYDDPSQLLGFYYRALHERKQTDFERGWKRWLPTMFPDGLQPAAATVPSAPQPTRGVTVVKDSHQLRKAGLQAGDLIVGLDGWRVDNLKQFRAINAFSERADRKLTVWRGRVSEVTLPWRSWWGTGVELRTYPIQGWAE